MYALLLNYVKSSVLWLCSDLSRLLASGRFSTLLLPSFQLGVTFDVSALISTIGIRAMATKTTMITKFEMKNFDRKSNFLW